MSYRADPPDRARAGGPPGRPPRRSRDEPASELPFLLDLRELALRLSLSERHIRRLAAERRIPYLKVGKLLRFDQAEIARWLEATRVPVHQPRWQPRVLGASGDSRATVT